MLLTRFSNFLHRLILDRMTVLKCIRMLSMLRFLISFLASKSVNIICMHAVHSMQLIILWSLNRCSMLFSSSSFCRAFDSNRILLKLISSSFANSIESDWFFCGIEDRLIEIEMIIVYFMLNGESERKRRTRNRQIYVTSRHS